MGCTESYGLIRSYFQLKKDLFFPNPLIMIYNFYRKGRFRFDLKQELGVLQDKSGYKKDFSYGVSRIVGHIKRPKPVGGRRTAHQQTILQHRGNNDPGLLFAQSGPYLKLVVPTVF
jgi:hypothetical protein